MCDLRRDYPGYVFICLKVFSAVTHTQINRMINSTADTKKTGVFVKEPLPVFIFDVSSFAAPLAFYTIFLILGPAATVLDL